MTPSLVDITIYSLLPALAMLLGGLIASVYEPGPRLSGATQHFAAGVVFAAVAKELLPKLDADHSPLALLIGFSLGVLSMLALKELSQKLSEKEEEEEPNLPGLPLGLVVAVGVDLLIDGVLIGVAFLAGTRGGLLIAIALAMEILFLGLSTTATLGTRGIMPSTRITLSLILAVLIPLGSLLGAVLLSQLPLSITAGFLAFGVAALLYLVTEELLTEAHEQETKETPQITACFFMGFLAILLLENLSG